MHSHSYASHLLVDLMKMFTSFGGFDENFTSFSGFYEKFTSFGEFDEKLTSFGGFDENYEDGNATNFIYTWCITI